MGIKSDILDSIVTTLEGITTANGYSLDVQEVQKQIAKQTDKLDAQERQAACVVWFSREIKEEQYGPYTDDLQHNAVAQFVIFAVMENTTVNTFLDFLEDIEGAISRDNSRGGLTDENYEVKYSWISDIDMVVRSEASAEDRLQEASLTLNVSYSYIPLRLSGTADRQG